MAERISFSGTTESSTYELVDGDTVARFLERNQLEFPISDILVNGSACTEDTVLHDGDKISLLSSAETPNMVSVRILPGKRTDYVLKSGQTLGELMKEIGIAMSSRLVTVDGQVVDPGRVLVAGNKIMVTDQVRAA